MPLKETIIQGKHTMNLPKFYPLENKEVIPDSSVKILFLLQLNGRNSRQISRLLRMIYNARHLYYVHVDDRQDFLYSGDN